MRTRLDDTVRIIRFRDGDTFIGDLTCGHCEVTARRAIRITGIESWEPSGKTKSLAMTCAYVLNSIWANKTGLFVPGPGLIDRYGRLVGDVNIDGILLSDSIVLNQMGWYGVRTEMPSHYDIAKIFPGGIYGNS